MASQSARSYTLNNYLVTPAQLDDALKKNVHSRLSTAPRTIPLCASWFLPNDPAGRTGIHVYKEGHIPRAQFFDLDEVKDANSPYPHMLPSPKGFAAAMSKLGIRRDDSVVVYDSKELGIFSAPRVAWTFKVFGHSHVHILNNFRLWCEQGYPVESGDPPPVEPVDYPVPELEKERVEAFESLKERIQEQNKEGAEKIQVLDARSRGRFEGSEPEPRKGLSSGHMPYSTSLPLSELLDPQAKAFLPPEELKAVFASLDIDPARPIISSCGTGVTAAIIDAALDVAGFSEAGRKLYDGSWTEWAQRVEPREHLIQKVGNE